MSKRPIINHPVPLNGLMMVGDFPVWLLSNLDTVGEDNWYVESVDLMCARLVCRAIAIVVNFDVR